MDSQILHIRIRVLSAIEFRCILYILQNQVLRLFLDCSTSGCRAGWSPDLKLPYVCVSVCSGEFWKSHPRVSLHWHNATHNLILSPTQYQQCTCTAGTGSHKSVIRHFPNNSAYGDYGVNMMNMVCLATWWAFFVLRKWQGEGRMLWRGQANGRFRVKRGEWQQWQRLPAAISSQAKLPIWASWVLCRIRILHSSKSYWDQLCSIQGK